jgi:hypothetical protein
VVNKQGTACGRCPAAKKCNGCSISPDDELLELNARCAIAVDWSLPTNSSSSSEEDAEAHPVLAALNQVRPSARIAVLDVRDVTDQSPLVC